ncbi:MAG: hypothetical protein KKC37_09070, partial [Proteobacteria bacterium]|nr:hypothetical protein [Pseudomonadota bacterium]
MRSVIIWATPWLGWLWLPLAERFKREYGARVEFVCNSHRDVAYFQSQDQGRAVDEYTDIEWMRREYGQLPSQPGQAVKARRFEDQTGWYLVDAIQTDRHWGHGFYSSGNRFPSSRPTPTYVGSLLLFNKVCQYWNDFFEAKHPDLVVGGGSGLEGSTAGVS